MIKPLPLPLRWPRRPSTSIFTTDGPTSSAAWTTAREYSSRSEASAAGGADGETTVSSSPGLGGAPVSLKKLKLLLFMNGTWTGFRCCQTIGFGWLYEMFALTFSREAFGQERLRRAGRARVGAASSHRLRLTRRRSCVRAGCAGELSGSNPDRTQSAGHREKCARQGRRLFVGARAIRNHAGRCPS